MLLVLAPKVAEIMFVAVESEATSVIQVAPVKVAKMCPDFLQSIRLTFLSTEFPFDFYLTRSQATFYNSCISSSVYPKVIFKLNYMYFNKIVNKLLF